MTTLDDLNAALAKYEAEHDAYYTQEQQQATDIATYKSTIGSLQSQIAALQTRIAALTQPTPTSATDPNHPAFGPIPAGYALAQQDNFDSGKLDPTLWGVYGISSDWASTSHAGIWAARNVSVQQASDGATGQYELQIKSWLMPDGKTRQGGALLFGNKALQKAGIWQWRARMEKGNGVEGVGLLWPDTDANWPEYSEYDPWECSDGQRQHVKSNYHLGSPGDTKAFDSYDLPVLDYTQWHDFSFVITPSYLAFSVDNIERNRNTTRLYLGHARRMTFQNDYLVPFDPTVTSCIWHVDNMRYLAPAA